MAVIHAPQSNPADSPSVIPMRHIGMAPLRALFEPLGLELVEVTPEAAIPGSYWGEPEAGLIGTQLFVRTDTPVHSVLHEGCHWLCMDDERRSNLRRDAGGSDVEENAVCYLQCVLADSLSGYSREQCFADMDAWGYTFVLGSAKAFFESDCDDARDFIQRHGHLASLLGVRETG